MYDKTMVTFSLCMIVKNEEAVLDRCLSSLSALMDEIIIVDTGSEDATKEIARQYTDDVYDFRWTGFFRSKELCLFQSHDGLHLFRGCR